MVNNFIATTCFGLIFVIHISSTLNLGLISGDLKRNSNPLIIRKTSHHSPITINIGPGVTNLQKLIPPVLPNKPSRIKRKIKKPIKSPKLLKLPKLPKLPLLPLIPPILPPILPKLPLLPLPILPKLPLLSLPILPLLPPPLLPIIPGLKKLKKPVKVPIIGRTKLQRALGSEIKSLKAPTLKINRKKKILDKLIKLKRDGSLTTSQYIRFRKLLL